MDANTNMQLWDSVQKTDPGHTKKVNQRGGFTSISAHYQVMRATEVFGPVGVGWGYDCGEPIFTGPFIIVPVKVWYRNRSNTFGPVYGSAEIAGARPDSDAPKKAMTDALTKALSHLGFNADVFLGKFDDNKYVAQMQAEFAEKPEASFDEQAARRKAKHDEALGRHSESVTYIKERIGARDLPAAVSEWARIGEEDQMALWLATTKGGCLTTAERKTIKENRLPELAEKSTQQEAA